MSVGHYQEHISRVSNLVQPFSRNVLQEFFRSIDFLAIDALMPASIIRWLFANSKMERLYIKKTTTTTTTTNK